MLALITTIMLFFLLLFLELLELSMMMLSGLHANWHNIRVPCPAVHTSAHGICTQKNKEDTCIINSPLFQYLHDSWKSFKLSIIIRSERKGNIFKILIF